MGTDHHKGGVGGIMRGPEQRPAVEARRLSFAFGKRAVLRDLAISVQPGTVFGMLGVLTLIGVGIYANGRLRRRRIEAAPNPV